MPRPKRGVFKRSQRKKVLIALYWWEDRVFEGVAQAAAEYGWILDCRMRWMHVIPQLTEWKGDGIIANPGFSEPLQPLLDLVKNSGIPTIELQSFGDDPCAARVILDQEAIGRMAARYFLSLGFRNLSYVQFADNQLEESRSAGFAEAAQAAGANVFKVRFGSLARTLARQPKPLALWAVNDVNAIDVLTACLDAGYRVPEEVAVMGADDSRVFCDFAEVPLSSVSCNFEEQGRVAARMLHEVMEGNPPAAETVRVRPSGVTSRRSADTIAVPDLAASRALRLIRDRFQEALKMPEIAREVGVSLRRLQNAFRRHFGFTMAHELARVRVEHSKELLTDRRLKLEAVALESGFSNRFHYIRAFQRLTGETPTAFRRRIRQEDSESNEPAHPRIG